MKHFVMHVSRSICTTFLRLPRSMRIIISNLCCARPRCIASIICRILATFYKTTTTTTTTSTMSKDEQPKDDSTSTSTPAPEVETATTDTAPKRAVDDLSVEDDAAESFEKAAPAKRTRTEVDTETPATDSDSDSVTATEKNTSEPPLDLAETFGYKQGDRLEVLWEVEMDGETTKKWWGATLDPSDGRTEDGVAIRVLHYDSFPEAGFQECYDDVIFMGEDLLVSPDSQTQLQYRRLGSTEPIVWYNERDLGAQLNNILMGALSKHSESWKSLPPAQQAAIAEKIAKKKEKLLEALKAHKTIITSASVKEILSKAFG
jgi:hypothetical protein